MKYLILIVFFILSGCAGVPFLHNNQVVKKDASKIIFELDSSDEEIFVNIKKAAVRDGYSISNQDRDTKSFSTDFKPAAQHGSDIATDVQINVYVTDKKVTIYGNLKQGLAVQGAINLGTIPIKLRGQEGSLTRVAWNELYRFSKQFSQDLTFE
jgi:hypothetical protein